MALVIWRHPRAAGTAGRCIGRTDVRVDRRKAKRLAHAVRREARRRGWPCEVWTSPLRRSAAVGEILASWGWVHHQDAQLAELDFGDWEGRCWDEIGAGAVQAWCNDFALHAPGGGESLATLRARCAAFLEARAAAGRPLLVVGHAGWMQAARLVVEGRDPPGNAAHWPAPPHHAEAWRFSAPAGAFSA